MDIDSIQIHFGQDALWLLNLCLAVVMFGVETGTFQKRTKEFGKISRAYHNHWVSFGGGSVTQDALEADLLITESRRSTSDLRYQYVAKNLGFLIGTRASSSTSSISQLTVAYDSLYLYCGGTYRFFPIDNPLSRWGLSFLQAELVVEHGTHEIEYYDGTVAITDDAASTGGGVGVSYHIPIVYDFWAYIGYQVQWHQYKFEDIEVDVKKPQSGYTLGVSYGF